jgi:hypothetical protein
MGLIVLLTGCDAGSSDTPSSTTAKTGVIDSRHSATPAGRLFEKEITKQSCDLLTIDSVAKVAGAPVSEITQRQMSSMCMYTWESGQASIGHLRASESAEAARDLFENSYANQSGEEVADKMAAIGAEVEKQKDAGKTDADPEHAKAVTSAMGGAFAGGFQYEDVPGLGDAARFETTKTETSFGGKTFVSYANSLHVLTGNLKFTVSFSLDGEPKMYRDETVALAEATLKSLPD